MGIFFTGDEEKLVTQLEDLNKTVGIAKTALDYTSQNEKHLLEFYRQTLSAIADKYDADLLLNLYATKNNISMSEVPSHMLQRLNNQ